MTCESCDGDGWRTAYIEGQFSIRLKCYCGCGKFQGLDERCEDTWFRKAGECDSKTAK